jgi:hypothetical protein
MKKEITGGEEETKKAATQHKHSGHTPHHTTPPPPTGPDPPMNQTIPEVKMVHVVIKDKEIWRLFENDTVAFALLWNYASKDYEVYDS